MRGSRLLEYCSSNGVASPRSICIFCSSDVSHSLPRHAPFSVTASLKRSIHSPVRRHPSRPSRFLSTSSRTAQTGGQATAAQSSDTRNAPVDSSTSGAFGRDGGWGGLARNRPVNASNDESGPAKLEEAKEKNLFRTETARSSSPPVRHGQPLANQPRTQASPTGRDGSGNANLFRRFEVRDNAQDQARGPNSSNSSPEWKNLRRKQPRDDGKSQQQQARPAGTRAVSRQNDNSATARQPRQPAGQGQRFVSLNRNEQGHRSFVPTTERTPPSKPSNNLQDLSNKAIDTTTEARQSKPPQDNVKQDKQETPAVPETREERMRKRLERLGRKVEDKTEITADTTASSAERSKQMQVSRNRRSTRYGEEDEEGGRTSYREREERERKKRLEKNQRRKDRDDSTGRSAPTPIELPPYVSVQQLATLLKVRPEDFVARLEELGFEDVGMDHVLDAENAGLVAAEYNFEPIAMETEEDQDIVPRPPPVDKSVLPQRPPVVTIMGHVDHGKTTILDYMRKSSVAANEHGGITQHIGAFSVAMGDGKLVTFLDTPGHAAFLSMRQRGANVTDIVILVVAADDSVKPQTIEAIKHAKAAGVPIIVAMNKIDKDEADAERVKQDLLRHELEVEDYGGDIQAVPVSGKTGQGIPALIEAMDSQAEILDLRAETTGPAEGWILEAEVKASGRVATVLVRRGTLRVGDVVVAGNTWARIRTLRNEAGVSLSEVGPGMPAEIDGWRDQPAAGDEVLQATDERRAAAAITVRRDRVDRAQAAVDMLAINETRRHDAERREREKAALAAAQQQNAASDASRAEKRYALEAAVSAVRDEMQSAAEDDDTTTLYFLVRADVGGSAEAVASAIQTLPLANLPLRIELLRSGVGAVSESDVALAGAVPAGRGVLVNFNQGVPPHIAQAAERAGVRVLDDNIIYRVTDAVRALVEDALPPLVSRRVLGDAEIAALFDYKVGKKSLRVAGCKVRNGLLSRAKRVRVFRGAVGNDEDLVFDGELSSLKNVKKDVPEMRKGSECGLAFEGWDGFVVGDVIQCYEEIHEKRRLFA